MSFLQSMALGAVISVNTGSSVSAVGALARQVNFLQSGLSGANVALRGLSRSFAVAASAGAVLTSGFAFAVNEAAKFEKAFAGLRSISEDSVVALGMLRQKSLELGTGAFGPTEIMQAMEEMSRAGFVAEEIMSGIGAVSHLAAAESIGMAKAMDLVTSNFRAFDEPGLTMNHMIDMLGQTSRFTNASILDLAQALKFAAQTTKLLKADSSEMLTLLGALGDVGIKSTAAGRNLSTALTRMASLTDKALGMKIMKKLGIGLIRNADGGVELLQTVQNIATKLGELGEDEKIKAIKHIFGQDAVRVMAPLINRINDVNRPISDLHEKIVNSQGAMKQIAETRLDNFLGQLTILKNTLKVAAINGTTLFLDPMRFGLVDLIDLVRQLDEGFKGIDKTFVNNVAIGMKQAFTDIVGLLKMANDKLVEMSTGLRVVDDNSKRFAQSLGYALGIAIVLGAVLATTFGTIALGLLFLSGLGEMLSVLAAGIAIGLVGAISAAIGAFAIWQSTGLGFFEFMDALMTRGLDLWGKFTAKVFEAGAGIESFLLPSLFLLSMAWDNVKQALVGAFDTFIDYFAPHFAASLGLFIGALAKIVAWFGILASWVILIGSLIFRYMLVPLAIGFVGVLDVVFSFMASLLSEIMNFITGALTTFLGSRIVKWALGRLGFDTSSPMIDTIEENRFQGRALDAAQAAKDAARQALAAQGAAKAGQAAPEVTTNVNVTDERCLHINNKLELDGREVGRDQKKREIELSERNGFTMDPWQKRQILYNGAAPVGGG